MRGQTAGTSAGRYHTIVRDLRAAAGDLSRVADAMEKILRKSGTPDKAATRRQRL
jgi:hypothetical protein